MKEFDQSEEPVIVVDDQDNQVEILPRKVAEADESKLIRYVYVLLFNDEGEVLLQRRNPDIERFPNHWEISASGAVWPGEGYVDAANRKLPDELNMRVPLFHEHKNRYHITGKADRFIAVFVGYVSNADLVQPNPEKVSEVRWIKPAEAKAGYLLTPSCEVVLTWWEKHHDHVMKNVKEQLG